MAMRDWNGDGKKDIIDNCIEYQIYQDVMNNNESIPYNPNQKSRHKDFRATTTDNKRVEGYDINGWTLLLVFGVVILSFVFLFKTFCAFENDEIGIGFLYLFFGIISVVLGKWLLMGKNIIKRESQDKYYNDTQNKDDK